MCVPVTEEQDGFENYLIDFCTQIDALNLLFKKREEEEEHEECYQIKGCILSSK